MELKKDIIESMNEDISNKTSHIADLVGGKKKLSGDRLKTLNFLITSNYQKQLKK